MIRQVQAVARLIEFLNGRVRDFSLTLKFMELSALSLGFIGHHRLPECIAGRGRLNTDTLAPVETRELNEPDGLGWAVQRAGYNLRIRCTISSRMMAPMVAVIRLPIQPPPAAMPR